MHDEGQYLPQLKYIWYKSTVNIVIHMYGIQTLYVPLHQMYNHQR